MRRLRLIPAALTLLTFACVPADQDAPTAGIEDMAQAPAEDMRPPLEPDMRAAIEPDMRAATEPDMRAPAEEDMGDEIDVDMGPELLEIPPRPWDVTQDGPYEVGYYLEDITYTVEPSGEDRTLQVVYWYPTRYADWTPARYLFGAVNIGDSFSEPPPEAPPGAEDGARWPLLVFSHGNGSIAEQNYFMTERFASHGWVVAAPYHTENTFRDNPSAINLRSSIDRPQDISAILDHMEALPTDHLLHGMASQEDIALSGHSFGAFTTLSVAGAGFATESILAECETGQIDDDYCDLFDERAIELFEQGFEDDRVKVAMPQAPGIWLVFREQGMAQIDIPTLLMTSGRDQGLPNAENGDPMWRDMVGGDHARFHLPDGGHFTYSNMCELLGFVDQAATDGCNETFLPIEQALPMINHYTLAFASYHLLGHTRHQALVEGEVMPYDPEVLVYETK